MQLKKLTSAALAAVVLTSSFTLATDVKAEDYKLDLLTVPFEEMGDALPDIGSSNRYDMQHIGKGYYAISGSNSSCSVVRITDNDLDKWRTTGEFSYTKINYDSSPIYNYIVDFDKGDYFSLYDSSSQYNVYKLDESSNSIVKQSTVLSADASNRAHGRYNSIIRYDGYSAAFEVNNSDTQDKVITVTVTAPDGTTKSSNLDYKNGAGNDYQIMLAYEGNTVCYVYIKSGDNQGLYSIDKEGNVSPVSALGSPDTGTVGDCYGDMTVYKNFIYFDGHNTNNGKRQAYFYSTENNTLYSTVLHDEATVANNGKLNPWYTFSDKMYSGKVISTKNGSGDSLCYIHDLVNDKIYANTATDTTVANVTKYFRITTTDGEIYHLVKGDSSWINSSGYGYFEGEFKEVFNDYVISTDFVGDYAAVTVDEKTYLIDKSFNQVSKSIDGNAWLAVGNGLYNVWVDGKQSLMTYCNAKPTPSTGSTDSTGSTETYHPVTITTTEEIISETNDVKIEFSEGVISEDTVLEVKEEETTKDTSVTLDISLKLDGKDVQPNGTVTVKIKKPDKLSGDKFYVYHVETDGSYTDMHAEYSDGFIIFKTDHFSKYVISTVQLSESTEATTTTTATENTENTDNANSDDNMPTGNKIATIIPIIAFASGITAAIAYNKRRK